MAYTTIDDPTIYFNTKLYTANATSDTAITGVGFQPDWLWIKNRTNAYQHESFDSVRGATKRLLPSDSDSETTVSGVTSFDSDGFTLGDAYNANKDSGNSIVAWSWKANGSGSSNSDGSITSTVSASTDSGFSIATWSGSGSSATIGHGLGASPELSFIKQRTGTQDWSTQATTIGYSKYLILNGNNAQANTSGALISSVSSTTISVDGNGYVNGSSNTYVGYFFSSIKGYSKIGKYTGNGNADGTFVYTGFKPAWVLIKRYSDTEYWGIIDNKRPGYNLNNKYLAPNRTDAEVTYGVADLLSNGFKNRGTGSMFNTSGSNYLYMAFAENPFVNSNGVPNNGE